MAAFDENTGVEQTYVSGKVPWWQGSGSAGRMTASFRTGIWRTVAGSKKRFLSIVVITLLGTTMLTGIRAACVDLRASADSFFDAQNLYDIAIQSTLGLASEDVDAIAALEGVDTAEGIYTQTAYTSMGTTRERVSVRSLSAANMDEPVLVEGELPQAADEVAVTSKYLEDSGKKLGDTVTFSVDEGETAVFQPGEYTITAEVRDPSDIMAPSTTNAFRSSGAPDYGFFVARSAAASPATFTAIHVTVAGASVLDCYGDAYEDAVDAVLTRIEGIRDEREQARVDGLKEQAARAIEQGQSGAGMQWTLMEQHIARMPAGSSEREQAQAELDAQRASVADQLAQAQEQVDNLGEATWYVQDRTSISSFSSVESDTSSIEVIGTIFPMIFFVVAVLIALTTATRMVEEERTLIGLYKALGYSKNRILSKYVRYTLFACLAGGILGDVLGYYALPRFLLWVFQAMYSMPRWLLTFDAVWAAGSVGLFALGIVGATVLACMAELRETPASLMRPRAPKAGSRILLERIGLVWRHLGFLNKVTARNLFRYKKRLAMTVFGIAGCTALVICGFGINDTVVSLSGKQYGQVTRYDLMAVASDMDFDDAYAKLAARGVGAENAGSAAAVEEALPLRVDTVSIEAGGKKESVQLYVVPTGADISDYVQLKAEDGRTLTLPAAGALLTKSAQMVMGVGAGDTLRVQDMVLDEADVAVKDVALSYLGNCLYMTQDAYEQAFGKTYEPNAVLANLHGSDAAQIDFAEDIKADGWVTVVATRALERDFNKNFVLVNAVVVFITAMAAGLAFVVVFTLSNTNISERERELATIKVLGFRAREVHTYINKETLLLTGLGGLLGIPAGWALTESFRYILQMPSLYFDVTIQPASYLYGVVLAFAFTLIVNRFTNRSLDRIVMVEALKSAE